MARSTDTRLRLRYFDVCAAVLGTLLLVYFLFSVRLGFWYPDEAFFYTVPQRLLNGDRLFLEEWNLTQLSTLFSVVPVWAYTAVTGGTEGLILFMRYVFVAVDMLFYAYMYLKLRPYRLWGVACALLFCGILPEMAFSLNYHSVSSMLVMAVCLMLLTGTEKKKPAKLMLGGAVFAFAVLAEPVLIFMFCAYSAAVALRFIAAKKRKQPQESAQLFSLRTWLWVTLGAFAVFVAFLALLLSMGSLQDLGRTLPYLFTGEDINPATVTDLSTQLGAFRLFGIGAVICQLACIAGAVWYHFAGKRNEKLRLALFLLSVLFFCAGCIHAVRVYQESGESRLWISVILYHELPVLLAAPVWCLLCGKKDRLVTGLCAAGLLYTLLVDLSSNVMVGSGGQIVQTAGLLALGMLLPSLKEDLTALFGRRSVFSGGGKLPRGVFYACVSVFCAVFLFWNLSYFCIQGFLKPAGKIFDDPDTPLYACTLQRGPYKNIRTSEAVAAIYEGTLKDIDEIVRDAQGAPLYIDTLAPYLYLHAGLPYGNYSAWDEEPLGRSQIYWNLFEEKKPGYIYIPSAAVGSLKVNYYPDALVEEAITAISEVFSVEAVKGEGGYILRVLGDAAGPSG